MMHSRSIRYTQEVARGLQSAGAVVALESALLSFGLPPPQNLETYRAMEEAVRQGGSIPAGTALIDGYPRMGLDDAMLAKLASGEDCFKASLGDLAWIVAGKRIGATTVAATLAIAYAAECPVFATGGIGGVHPGLPDHLDVSADLAALGKFGLTVVCAGAKAILDIPKTMETLEALGVAVVGYGTDEFPLFYSRSSGISIRSAETMEELVAIIRRQRWLGLGGCVLVANPIPTDAELPRQQVDEWILEAESQAREQGVRGRERTPFVLGRLAEISRGLTVEANKALLIHNARVAGELSRRLASFL